VRRKLDDSVDIGLLSGPCCAMRQDPPGLTVEAEQRAGEAHMAAVRGQWTLWQITAPTAGA
jgi:hypothetical protein